MSLAAPKTLSTGSGDKEVQTLYVRLTNGTTLLFIGPPLPDDDFHQIENMVFGDLIPEKMLDLAGDGAGTTAQ